MSAEGEASRDGRAGLRRLGWVSWLGCGLALVAVTQPWWTAGERSAITGAEAVPAAMALLLAAAAGCFLGVWLGGVARRIVLGLVVVLALGAAAVAAGAELSADQTGLLGAALTPTVWRWLYLAGVVVAGLGALAALIAGPAPRRRPATGTPDPALDAWKALDSGDDPTLAEEESGAGDARLDPQE